MFFVQFLSALAVSLLISVLISKFRKAGSDDSGKYLRPFRICFIIGLISFVGGMLLADKYPRTLVFPLSGPIEQIEIAGSEVFIGSEFNRIQRFAQDGKFLSAMVPDHAGGTFRFEIYGDTVVCFSARTNKREVFSRDGALLETLVLSDEDLGTAVDFFAPARSRVTYGLTVQLIPALGVARFKDPVSGASSFTSVSLLPPFLALDPVIAWLLIAFGHLVPKGLKLASS